jgi:hypothetical protein
MRIRASLVVVGLIVCAGLVCGEERHDGYLWLKMNRDEKMAWAIGFDDGIVTQTGQASAACSARWGRPRGALYATS